MTTPTELRVSAAEIAAAGHAGWGNAMTDAADQIAALTAERDRFAKQLGECSGGYQTMEKEIAGLRAELANLRAADIHSCHAGCTRSDCVNARLRILLAESAQMLNYIGGSGEHEAEHVEKAEAMQKRVTAELVHPLGRS